MLCHSPSYFVGWRGSTSTVVPPLAFLHAPHHHSASLFLWSCSPPWKLLEVGGDYPPTHLSFFNFSLRQAAAVPLRPGSLLLLPPTCCPWSAPHTLNLLSSFWSRDFQAGWFWEGGCHGDENRCLPRNASWFDALHWGRGSMKPVGSCPGALVQDVSVFSHLLLLGCCTLSSAQVWAGGACEPSCPFHTTLVMSLMDLGFPWVMTWPRNWP